MQRLVLAILVLGVLVLAAGLALRVLRDAYRTSAEATEHGPVEGGLVAKLSYTGLFLLIVGVTTGWLGGL